MTLTMPSKLAATRDAAVRSSLARQVAVAATAAAILDAAFAFLAYVVVDGRYNLETLLQYIASGVFGDRAFASGAAGIGYAAAGFVIHFAIALTYAVFYAATPIHRHLTAHRTRVLVGLAYGAGIWIFMNAAVLPLTQASQEGFLSAWYNAFLIDHAFLVGLPIALLITNTTNPTPPRRSRSVAPELDAARDSHGRTSTNRLSINRTMLVVVAGLGLTAAACGTDDAAGTATADTATAETTSETSTAEEEAMENSEDRPVLELSFGGLEPLGDDFNYEGWVVVEGEVISTGVFDIAEDGSIDAEGTSYGHESSEAVVISIEPANDTDPAPAATKVLGGIVNPDGTFELGIEFPAALGTNFSESAGQFILATPTDDPDGNELSGVWFLTVPGPEQGLHLPELPEGWAYEGWAVVDGQPISTGRFTDPGVADDFAGFSGTGDAPPYPGEDFVSNAPDGLTFPTDLTGATIVISVEPDADNSPAPFALKPLMAEVPDGTEDHTNLTLNPGPVAISGSGSIIAG